MQIPRFFISSQDIEEDIDNIANQPVPFKVSICSQNLVKQLIHVLRLKPGAIIQLLDNQGNLWDCTLVNSGKVVTCEAIKQEKAPERQLPQFSIGLPLIKGPRFEYCLEKLTEIGISQIVPIHTERTIVKVDSESQKIKRWQIILKEASEQSERWTIPHIVEPIKLSEYIDLATRHPFNVGFICTERLNVLTLRSALNRLSDKENSSKNKAPNQVSVLIGPEGGFSKIEIEQTTKFGFESVSLGKKILRSETAAIYALSLITSHFEN